MCCTSAKNLFRLVMIGGLILFGGSVRLFADESAEKKASEPTAEASSDAVHPSSDEHSHDDQSSDAAHAEPSHEGGHDTGVPLQWKADLAFFSLVTFLLFVFVLGKFAWGPMIKGLDSREAGIQKAISDAEEGRRKSQVMLAEYEQRLKAAEQTVQSMVAEARRDAERTSQDLLANAQREVEAIKERAKDDIRQAKDSALVEVFTQMNSQVVLATEHVLGRALQDSDQDRLVSQVLAEIGR
jgi:F-type H+-transporting ATPase subunit b